MKITKKILENIIEEELKALALEEIVKEEVEKILEQGVDPVVGKPVSLGGQRISREEAFEAFEAELSKMHDPKVVSRFMEALEERLSGI